MRAAGSLAPAWYVLRSRHPVARWINTLHLPYTLLHLSFVVLGFALAPSYRLGYSLAVLLAFALAMGGGGHFLDLLAGDPLNLALPRRQLQVAAGLTIAAAFALGLLVVAALGIWWYLALVCFGVWIVVAYNLEWFGGIFHTDHWFAFAWGAFPYAAGYLVNHEALTYQLALGMIFCYAMSRLQRVLSTRARLVRRRVMEMSGHYRTSDGQVQQITPAWLIDPQEKALIWLCVGLPLLAVLLVI